MSEVRFTHLLPAELRDQRDAFPVAWLPLGTLEWHGRHLPLGVDGIAAEALCRHGASSLGGISFPAMYYGDHRGIIVEALAAPGGWTIPLSFDHRVECCEELGVSQPGVAANAVRDHELKAGAAHVELIERAFWMIRAYGFSRIAAYPGHGGNVIPLRLAMERFHAKQESCRAVAIDAHELGVEEDHAGAWETSLMMHFTPELVRAERLAGDRPEEPTGVAGEHPRNASAERGRETAEQFVAAYREALGEVPPAVPVAVPDEDGTGDRWIEEIEPLFETPDVEGIEARLEAMHRGEMGG